MELFGEILSVVGLVVVILATVGSLNNLASTPRDLLRAVTFKPLPNHYKGGANLIVHISAPFGGEGNLDAQMANRTVEQRLQELEDELTGVTRPTLKALTEQSAQVTERVNDVSSGINDRIDNAIEQSENRKRPTLIRLSSASIGGGLMSLAGQVILSIY